MDFLQGEEWWNKFVLGVYIEKIPVLQMRDFVDMLHSTVEHWREGLFSKTAS